VRYKATFFWGKKAFFPGNQRPFFSESKRPFFSCKILEFSVEIGKKRRSVVFLTDHFLDLLYKKKRFSKFFRWKFFQTFV